MIFEESDKYESRLVTLVNTRLMFNNIEQLEDFVGNHAIHSNGIKRCYASPQKLRALYRDFKLEVYLQTDELFDLDWLMRHYERAWSFYKKYFGRRKYPEKIALKLLRNHYALINGDSLPSKSLEMVETIRRERVNIAMLTLLLLKALPGYDSKLGDATDVSEQFDKVIQFLEEFTKDCGLFDVLPVIKLAKEEQNRTRLMLIYHTIVILDTYENYLNPINIAATNSELKENAVELDITGIWREGDQNAFWEIGHALNPGVYFATRYERESPRLLSFTRYTLQLLKDEGNRMVAYFLHPIAMKHRVAGLPYGDIDHAWYLTDYPATESPDEMTMVRTMQSDHWPAVINLMRVTDPKKREKLESDIHNLVKIDSFEACNYEFTPGIYAISQDAVYVFDEKGDCFYKLPRFTEHEFEKLTLDDFVGILEMGPEESRERYLAIDERLLYIPLTSRQLNKYGITKVKEM